MSTALERVAIRVVVVVYSSISVQLLCLMRIGRIIWKTTIDACIRIQKIIVVIVEIIGIGRFQVKILRRWKNVSLR